MASAFAYRSKEDSTSDSDSGDSEKECLDWKRATKPNGHETKIPPPVPPAPLQNSLPCLKRKRNNIWCDVLQDQMISEDLGGVLLKNKPKGYGSRGHESYDYTLRYKYPKLSDDLDCNMSEDDLSGESETNSVLSTESSKFKSKFVKLDNAGAAAARKIVRVLGEKKQYLIYRIVKLLGIEKAMNLLKMTEEIEENGGMMVKNQARRRTPGGVYFQLLKSEKGIDKEVMDKIFEGEMTSYEAKRMYAEKRKTKKRTKKKKTQKNSEDLMEVQSGGNNQEQQIMLLDGDKSTHADLRTVEKEQLAVKEVVTRKNNDADLHLMEGQSISNNAALFSNTAVKECRTSDLEDGEIED